MTFASCLATASFARSKLEVTYKNKAVEAGRSLNGKKTPSKLAKATAVFCVGAGTHATLAGGSQKSRSQSGGGGRGRRRRGADEAGHRRRGAQIDCNDILHARSQKDANKVPVDGSAAGAGAAAAAASPPKRSAMEIDMVCEPVRAIDVRPFGGPKRRR